MSPLALLLIKRLAGNRGVEANPYFDDPGSAPYTDSTFDAYSQLPAKSSNFWQRMSGDNFGDRINSQYLSTLSQQPLLQNMARFEKDMRLEEKKELAKIEQQLERDKMSQLGKTAFDTFEDQYQYPFDFSGTDEDIGRRFSLAYGPQMRDKGIAGFSDAESTIARNFADTALSENARTVAQAQQPFVGPTARDLAARAEIEAKFARSFAENPGNARLFDYAQRQKLAPNITTGNTVFDPGAGLTYQGSMPTEVQSTLNIGTPEKPMLIPQTRRGYTDPSIQRFPGAVPITNPNTGNPAEVQRQNEFMRQLQQQHFENYGTTLDTPNAEATAGVRNQELPINPTTEQTTFSIGNTDVVLPKEGLLKIPDKVREAQAQQKQISDFIRALLKAGRITYGALTD